MFFYYYPKGILQKRPINVYEVPAKFNIDEDTYLKLADDLYASIKKLRQECIKNNEKAWSNLTISIEDLKYKVEYGYECLTKDEFDSSERKAIWTYKYLSAPYESFNRKERKAIDTYMRMQIETNTFELPLYKKEVGKKLDTIKQIEKNLDFVTDKKIEEMEFMERHVPKSQILNPK